MLSRWRLILNASLGSSERTPTQPPFNARRAGEVRLSALRQPPRAAHSDSVDAALGVSQVEAARRMKIPFQRLNAIVKGRRAVSADTALLLEALTRWDAQIWLTLQAKWDLWHALRSRGKRPRVKALPRLATQAAS